MSRRELWGRALRDPATWGRALRVGAPVGLLQAAIHQGDAWLRLAVDASVVTKTVVSPLVGFTLDGARFIFALGSPRRHIPIDGVPIERELHGDRCTTSRITGFNELK